MSRIQSSVGLITGVPIIETVDQLIAISARPRDLLTQRTKLLQAQQVAVTEVTALVVATELAVKRLGETALFQRKQASSSLNEVLAATITGTPVAGSYRFTPVKTAQAHQVLSDGFAKRDEALGGGQIAIRFGGFVERGVSLDELNGGNGVERGKIRITDRSGSSAVIDLRAALTIDDVVKAINSADTVAVTASAVGDRLKLVDDTGQTLSNLKVQEVGLGRTAADLGLAGINVADSSALGNDVLRLHWGTSLQSLNDGNGVRLRQGVQDLEITFRDGSAALQIEFNAQTKGSTAATAVTKAANGLDAQIQFTSVGTGETYDGYRIEFVDDERIAAGSETVQVNTAAKQVTVRIDAGNTRAYQVIAALNNDSTAKQYFTAAPADGGNASGLVTTTDAGVTSGGAAAYNNEKTVGDLLATLNAADPARLQARLSAGGDRIELVDLTDDNGGTFEVKSLFGGSVAEDLGLAVSASEGVISGRRRLAGLDTVLLDSLAGGRGFATLGQLSLQDRSGASATIDLSQAETLDDVLEAINQSGAGIKATVNAARNGLLLRDTSGGAGPLVIDDADATQTATKLGIKSAAAADTVDSGSLDLQTFHEMLTLSSLNNGKGVQKGSFLITDSSGKSAAVNLRASEAQTVGDVIDLINALDVGVQASINDTGDGLLLHDTAGGSETLKVADVGNGTAAADLRIAGTAVTTTRDGEPAQIIDGSTTLRIELGDEDTLDDLISRINAAGAGVSASVLYSGTGTAPYRLSLTSQYTGRAGELLIDGLGLGTRFREVTPADDAVLLVGASGSSAGSLAVSSTNAFDQLISGVTLTIKKASNEEVTVDIAATSEPVFTQINMLVEQYNKLRDKLDQVTAYNETDKTTGILFGSSEALRLESDLSRLITARFAYTGPVQSLEDLGLSLDDRGKLSFDKSQYEKRHRENPEAVQQFFIKAETGVVARFTRLTEQLAGRDNSVLMNRVGALQKSIDNNTQRIADMNASLARERERLLTQFYNLETIVAALQSNLTAIESIKYIAPITSSKK